MDKKKITLCGQESGYQTELWAEPGQSIATMLQAAAAPFALPCAGQRHCGKCLVWVRGGFSPADAAEQALLLANWADVPPPPGYLPRLACFCRVEEEGQVLLPAAAAGAAEVNFAALPLAAAAGEDLAVALDVGTTSLAVQLFSAARQLLLAEASVQNAQTTYGADVLSRIGYANQHGHLQLHRVLLLQIGELLDTVLAASQAAPGQIQQMVAVGNPTMLHFLAGLDPRGLGLAPFQPQSRFGSTLPAGWFDGLAAEASVYLPPTMGAFLGADLGAAILASHMTRCAGNSLLLDIGTNAELALWQNGRLLCCSTAAGPAFEAAEISMGMAALPGAIDRLWWQGGELCWHTLGAQPPRGICGSGLVSAVAALLQAGLINADGQICPGAAGAGLAFEAEGTAKVRLGNSGIVLTQQDIRQLQLAKAAVAAGIRLLLAEAGLAASDVQQLYLAGSFGRHLDCQAAAALGLLPAAWVEKTRPLGNAALAGAAMLLDPALRPQLEQLAEQAEELLLADHADFFDSYLQALPFRQC